MAKCWKSGRSTLISACHSCRWRCRSGDWALVGAYDVHQKTQCIPKKRNIKVKWTQVQGTLRADGGSPGCSSPVSYGCGAVYSCPGKGPAARPCSGGALDPAVLMSCGCPGPCEGVRCGSFHQGSSGCAARWLWSGLLCGWSAAFFGPAGSETEDT